MKSHRNEGKPMWVSAKASHKSLSVINNNNNDLIGHSPRARGRNHEQFSRSISENYNESSNPSYGRRISPAYLPSVSSISGVTPSNLSTLTYSSSTTRSSSSSSFRQPIRATTTSYEPSISISSSITRTSTRSKNKKSWRERINLALEQLFPTNTSFNEDETESTTSSPVISLFTSNNNNNNHNNIKSNTSSKNNRPFLHKTNTDPQVIRFTRTQAASLKDHTQSKLASIIEDETIKSTSKVKDDISTSKSPPSQLKTILNSSKSVFIVASLCILCGSSIFSVSYSMSNSVSTTADSIQLIGLMFVGMGLCIFFLAILFTLCSFHLSKYRYDDQKDTA